MGTRGTISNTNNLLYDREVISVDLNLLLQELPVALVANLE